MSRPAVDHRSLERELEERLAELARAGLRRSLSLPCGVDLSSNDYLGLAGDPSFREAVLEEARRLERLSAPSSRLLRGHLDVHAEVEAELAEFKGTESALVFASGYQANLALLTSLAGRTDRVLSDRLNHASLIDGIRLSGARRHVYPHLDLGALEDALRRPWPDGRTFIVTESWFSMDGDVAPLQRIADLAETHGASLIVDDAHATGVFGSERGSGLVEELGVTGRAAAVTSTFGKALGGSGAFVAGPRVLREWLVHRARPFIFTTAVPPLVLALARVGVRFARAAGERRARVHAASDRLRSRLREHGIDCLDSVGPILPVVLGDNRRALEVAERLQSAGFDVRAVRPPTVPEGTARLRVSVHADHDDATIDRLAAAIISLVVPRPPAEDDRP